MVNCTPRTLDEKGGFRAGGSRPFEARPLRMFFHDGYCAWQGVLVPCSTQSAQMTLSILRVFESIASKSSDGPATLIHREVAAEEPIREWARAVQEAGSFESVVVSSSFGVLNVERGVPSLRKYHIHR